MKKRRSFRRDLSDSLAPMSDTLRFESKRRPWPGVFERRRVLDYWKISSSFCSRRFGCGGQIVGHTRCKESMHQADCDVMILGAGASGLMCAAVAAARGRKTLVLDHADVFARKVRISGGGRCNFTNLRASAEDYVCGNPHFPKSALARFTPADAVELLRGLELPAHEEEGGKIFCESAEQAAEALLGRARRAGARLLGGAAIQAARRDGNVFRVDTSVGSFRASSLVLALGGPAWPQIGATAFGCKIARSFGLGVTQFRPGLAPFIADGEFRKLCRELSGVSLPARVAEPHAAEGGLLFTHSGLSGPAALDASLYWREGRAMVLDLAPDVDLAEKIGQNPRRSIKNILAQVLPKRLASLLCEAYGWDGVGADLSKKRLEAIEGRLHGFSFTPAKTAGWPQAEAALGGVDVGALSSKTMGAKDVPGLYCIGELLDVTGRVGGFNLQWAWSSGAAAGEVA